jgi:hypothetical protein
MHNCYRHLCFALVLGLPLVARAQQPFEQFGIKVKILSLSNGRYPEYFPNDSLRRIGTVVYDTRLKRVAYLLPADSLVGRAKSEITSRWWVVDPLAEKSAHISPYVFVRNNAVRFNDPDGREEKDVILRGNKRQEALQQLQASVQGSLNLSMDKNGKVAYTPVAGATQSKGASQLATAIDDHSVTVNVSATDRQTNSKGGALIGGSFMGTTVSRTPKGDGTNGPNQAQTQQELNVPSLVAMDAQMGKPGATTLHEVVESYLAGKLSQQTGISSGVGGTFPSFYQQAHGAAPPQSGNVNEVKIDQFSHEYQGLPGQVLSGAKYTVGDATHQPATFWTFP